MHHWVLFKSPVTAGLLWKGLSLRDWSLKSTRWWVAHCAPCSFHLCSIEEASSCLRKHHMGLRSLVRSYCPSTVPSSHLTLIHISCLGLLIPEGLPHRLGIVAFLPCVRNMSVHWLKRGTAPLLRLTLIYTPVVLGAYTQFHTKRFWCLECTQVWGMHFWSRLYLW